MDDQKLKAAAKRTDYERQCPICAGETRVRSSHRTNSPRNIFSKSLHTLFHQRHCGGCGYSFSTLIISDLFWAYFRPFLVPIFPRMAKKDPSEINNFFAHMSQVPYVPGRSVPSQRKKKSKSGRRKHEPLRSSSAIPFLINPISRTVSINLECPLGNGKFGSELEAAASSLEAHLRETADQIRRLVEESPPSNSGKDELVAPIANNAPPLGENAPQE